MKNWIAIAALSLAPGLLAGTALAATGDATVGAQKAAICGACHGANGNSANPEWPSLAGQHAEYIAAQLKAFQEQRSHLEPATAQVIEPDTGRNHIAPWRVRSKCRAEGGVERVDIFQLDQRQLIIRTLSV